MPTVLRALLLSALLTLVPVAIGVAVAEDDRPPESRPTPYAGTSLADFDSSRAVVQRTAFCDRVHPEAVREALGGEGELSAWDNGQPTAVLPDGEDVAHEYGCLFTGEDGTEARGWVFAPPVPAAKAADLVRSARTAGCEVQPDAPEYGAPSVALVCTSGGRRSASYRGLFGDAWLACSLDTGTETPVAELVETAGRWCVAVAQAASAT